MAKKKKQHITKKPPVAKVNMQELHETRDGGQIALKGYSYQFHYSCDLILSSSTDTIFTLEGIEDIDTIKCGDGNKIIAHFYDVLSRLPDCYNCISILDCFGGLIVLPVFTSVKIL